MEMSDKYRLIFRSPITTLRIRGVFDYNLADKTKNPKPNVQRFIEKPPLNALVSIQILFEILLVLHIIPIWIKSL